MSFLWRYVLVVAALMAGSLLLAGCGGGEEGLALDEYFRQLGEIEEAADARAEMLEQESQGVGEDLSDRLADLESLSEFDALIAEVAPPFEEITERLDEACFELQGIADENGIAVDLGCEE